MIVSKDGFIEVLNASAAEMFGWPADELKGRHISALLPNRYQESHTAHMERYVAAPAKRSMGDHITTPALHRSGAEFPVLASLSAITTDEGTSVICILRVAP